MSSPSGYLRVKSRRVLRIGPRELLEALLVARILLAQPREPAVERAGRADRLAVGVGEVEERVQEVVGLLDVQVAELDVGDVAGSLLELKEGGHTRVQQGDRGVDRPLGGHHDVGRAVKQKARSVAGAREGTARKAARDRD